jgi:hypothetical protein
VTVSPDLNLDDHGIGADSARVMARATAGTAAQVTPHIAATPATLFRRRQFGILTNLLFLLLTDKPPQDRRTTGQE